MKVSKQVNKVAENGKYSSKVSKLEGRALGSESYESKPIP